MADTKNVLMDVGTGYYVERSTADASDFCKRRVSNLQDNIANLQDIIFEKRQGLQMITQVLQMKLGQQAAAAAKTAAA